MINFLTILQALFLPATFLVGFWGMNFPNMPLIGARGGYIIAAAIIIGFSIGLYRLFHAMGWLKAPAEQQTLPKRRRKAAPPKTTS